MNSKTYLPEDQVLVPLLESDPLIPCSRLHAYVKSVPQFLLGGGTESTTSAFGMDKPNYTICIQKPLQKTHLKRVLGGALGWDGGNKLRFGGTPCGVALGLLGEDPCLLGDVLRKCKMVSGLGVGDKPLIPGDGWRGGGAYGAFDDSECG
jgi:hypothetical protein